MSRIEWRKMEKLNKKYSLIFLGIRKESVVREKPFGWDGFILGRLAENLARFFGFL